MKFHQLFTTCILLTFPLIPSITASESKLPEEMRTIMNQEKYDHSLWGIYVKDLDTGKVLFDQNSEKLFSPASTTKLFSVEALLDTFGDGYRYKTPVFSSGRIEDEKLHGNLILVAQGDLTMGGRQPNPDTISYTKMDHTIANEVPGAILTKEDPLAGLNALAKQVYEKGIKEINGDVIIDDTLFETIEKREMILTPIMINENLIDFVINPSSIGQNAKVTWRPQVPGYEIDNQVKTVAKGQPLEIGVSSDKLGHKIRIEGSIPADQSDIIRTFSIKDPKSFARAAFIQALEQNGVKVNVNAEINPSEKPLNEYKDLQQVALWTSPPLSEYAKLILKVSHNLGADLIPLLLASHDGKKTYNEGMRIFGDFVVNKVKISPDSFVFIDGAGGNENRLTPQAEIQLLEYVKKQKPAQFASLYDALPILGVDGSLADFAKNSPAAGKVRAKPGTGISFNLATERLFLITQAYSGYIEGKDGHLYAYMVVVNNASIPSIEAVFSIFEDEGQLSNSIYMQTETKSSP